MAIHTRGPADEADRAERRRRIVELAAELSDDFETRAAEHDRDASLPHENFARMRETGFLALTVPEELGGMGGGLVDLMSAIERLSRGCASTALAAAMHLAHVAYMSDEWRRTGEPKFERVLRLCGEGAFVLSGAMSETETGSHIAYGTTTATRVDGGFLINGKKIFCTTSPGMTHFRSAGTWHSPDGPRMVNYMVPAGTPGLKPLGDWDTMGMRATGSQSIQLDNMFVPDEHVWEIRTPGVFDNFLVKLMFYGWLGAIVICYVGIAGAMRDFAVNWAGQRIRYPNPRPVAFEPGTQAAVARIDADLTSARTLLYNVAQAYESEGNWTLEEMLMRGGQVKYVASRNVVRIAHDAMYLIGGLSYFKKLPFERMYRDVISMPFHPRSFDDAEEALGKHALGIPLNCEPRWG